MFHLPHSFFQRIKKGFSTAEVILSMFVLTVGLIAVMNLISHALQHSLANRDVIIAAELAQEGVELVRNVRDNDFAQGNDGFSAFDNSEKYCRVDFDDSADSLDCVNPSGSPQNNPSRYRLQYQNGLYGHYSSTQERFSRLLYVDYNAPGGGNNNALVRSFVYWGPVSPPSNPADPASCTSAYYCVFTELYLTSWK